MNNLDALREAIVVEEVSGKLDLTVQHALIQGKRKLFKRLLFKRTSFVLAVCAAFMIFINVSPVISSALSDVPIVGKFVKVLLVKNWHVNEGTINVNINTPQLSGIGNDELEKILNEKYIEENKMLYESFASELEEMKQMGAHMGIDSDFFIVTDTERIFTIGRYFVNLVGSSSTTIKYDTIDPSLGIAITLKSLFKDDSYIKCISDEIERQMIDQMTQDPDKIYWVGDEFTEYPGIEEEQSFYITEKGKLIISFDKYVVAPGYMGVCTFEIPYDVIKDILVSDTYIKP